MRVLTKACGASNTRSTFSSLPLTHSSEGLSSALLLLLLLCCAQCLLLLLLLLLLLVLVWWLGS